MKEVNPFISSIADNLSHYDRRRFIGYTGRGILAASLLGQFHNAAAQQLNISAATDTIPVKLSPLHHPTEKEQGDPPAPLNPDQRIGYALVGLGTLTLGQLLPAFGNCKYSKPVALVSGDPVKAKKVAGQYGINEKNIYNYKNFDQIKNNAEIDAVYIVLPNSMHAEYTIRAAQAGKHVLCEKPMAMNVKEAQSMIDACKKANKKLMIAYRIQYEPHNRMAMQWVRDKKYGTVKLIESVNVQNIGDPQQWRLKKSLSGGGALPDIGIYCLNTCRFLLGEEPEEVAATIYSTPGDVRFKEVEESVLFQLKFPGGALVNCTTSYGVHNSKRYRAFADKGGWFGMDPAFDYQGLKMEVSQAENKTEWRQNPSLGEKNQFALEIDHLSQCIMNNTEPYTSGEEGLQDHRIMEVIYESARQNKSVKLEKINGTDIFRKTPPRSE